MFRLFTPTLPDLFFLIFAESQLPQKVRQQKLADFFIFKILNFPGTMSKRELKNYLKELTKEQLEAQIIDLYGRFKDVKEFYDFAFNPDERKMQEQFRWQIGKEYFPVNGRRAKARRSVAQKIIRKLLTLGAEPSMVADLMLYNLEIAQAFSAENRVRQESFYASLYKSFDEALKYISENGISRSYRLRIEKIVDETIRQRWPNRSEFERLAEMYIQ